MSLRTSTGPTPHNGRAESATVPVVTVASLSTANVARDPPRQ
jgi:hypothetical protein